MDSKRHGGKEAAMYKIALLVLIAAFAAQAADARVKVVGEIPEDYWGEWTTGVEPCKSGDTKVLVLSAKAYAGPLGKCDVVSEAEIPGQNGATYSARMLCTNSSQTQKKTSANLIMRPGDANQIAVGSTFQSLRDYQRCPEKTPASQ
jgi:hypothetical protein